MITLPSNVQWLTPDLAVAVVPGDKSHIINRIGPDFGKRAFVAPQEWVQYNKPCETCAGIDFDRDGYRVRCPDCWDGRQVWDVRWIEPVEPDYGEAVAAECWVSARATIQVVPVVAIGAPGDPIPDGPWISVALGGVIASSDTGLPDGFDWQPDPLPVPGRDWVLVNQFLNEMIKAYEEQEA